jgi:hypothetical protein
MKKPIDNGGPAFPYGEANFTDKFSQGMTLRDYFAAAALQGILAYGVCDGVAEEAYNQADQMLTARKEKP